ncbi:MAG: cytochrome c biogenesis protein CcsA [Bacteroidia bacterium]|nr:cytochrome c biogenesis protein CcsA [Bacteroidia bacterium]
MDIQYIGEALGFGKFGNLLIALSFSGAILAAISYFFSFKRPSENKAWQKLARSAFFIHSISVIGIFALLYYLIFNHRFEYYYVWQHSSTNLPWEYIFASFWEGQEGSFLLWTFWHIVLAWFIIKRGGNWEAPVMVTVSLVQAFLMSMVLGVTILGYKLGTNPFVLLREHPDMANLPFIKMADYLSRIDDGRGLNPLLQNYWMVIHPPVLFLGFAATLIPFAFAMAGMMTKRLKEWTTPALSWSFFGVMTLGTGILMGAAWAYEALSFGGFWAWDPVENASLVPWLTLVGAAHVMLIHKKNGSTLMSSLLLVIATFILILYSTFLTRSGILGDTSVHAFTDLGMTGQLLVYMLFFVVQAGYLIFINRKEFPKGQAEDPIYSREFWMFIGMLVLVISGLQITFTTSIPVINKVFGTNMAPPADVIAHYNSWQIPFAIIIAILIGVGQYFKYKKTAPADFWKKVSMPLIFAVIISAVALYFIKFDNVQYMLLFFSCMFALLANLDYSLRVLKGNFDFTGGSVAHIGIALILLGSLLSNGKSQVISQNLLNIDLGKDFPNNENIMLTKGDTLQMGEYLITYKGKEKIGVNVFYEIEYLKPDYHGNNHEYAFTLKPRVQLNPRMGNVSEPDTKHFLSRDIYTHVTYADLDGLEKPEGDGEYAEAKQHSMSVGDTISTSNALVYLKGLSQDLDRNQMGLQPNDIAVGAVVEVIDINKKKHEALPLFIIKNNTLFAKDVFVDELGLKMAFTKIDPDSGKFELTIAEKKNNKREFIIMKAVIFPQINVLWSGCILLILGSVMAIRKRMRDNARRNIEEN